MQIRITETAKISKITIPSLNFSARLTIFSIDPFRSFDIFIPRYSIKNIAAIPLTDTIQKGTGRSEIGDGVFLKTMSLS